MAISTINKDNKMEKGNYFPFFAAEDCARGLKSCVVLVFSELGFIFDGASGVIFFVTILILLLLLVSFKA
jgi:hypothetical protein